MTQIVRPQPADFPSFYHGYVELIEGGNILHVMREQQEKVQSVFEHMSEPEANHAYAEGKWTIKEVLGHLTDAERIFVFRALSFARGETQPLTGFDENKYVPAGRFNDLPIQALLIEFTAVRQATREFFDNLHPECWSNTGIANQGTFTVSSIAYIIAGHVAHHLKILEERYF